MKGDTLFTYDFTKRIASRYIQGLLTTDRKSPYTELSEKYTGYHLLPPGKKNTSDSNSSYAVEAELLFEQSNLDDLYNEELSDGLTDDNLIIEGLSIPKEGITDYTDITIKLDSTDSPSVESRGCIGTYRLPDNLGACDAPMIIKLAKQYYRSNKDRSVELVDFKQDAAVVALKAAKSVANGTHSMDVEWTKDITEIHHDNTTRAIMNYFIDELIANQSDKRRVNSSTQVQNQDWFVHHNGNYAEDGISIVQNDKRIKTYSVRTNIDNCGYVYDWSAGYSIDPYHILCRYSFVTFFEYLCHQPLIYEYKYFTLNAKEIVVIILKFFHELTNKEMAEELDVTLQTIYNRWNHAKDRIYQAYTPYYERPY